MDFQFKNKAITGILTILPSNEVKFEEEIKFYNFPQEKSLKLKEIMGYNTRRIFSEKACVSDIAVFGMRYLSEKGLNNIDALIVVTQSPDYFMPSTSSVIHGRLGLSQDVFCMDINQGCAGYIVGLFQAFMLLDQPSINKVALINADILSKKVSKYDRNSNPLIGDAVSITIVEKSHPKTIYGNIKADGSRHEALMIPAGGFKRPSNTFTSILKKDESGNLRSDDNLVMKGDEVFSFVMSEIPAMIEELLSGVGKDRVDYFMFHQPNRFMLQKLADKLSIPYEKMPMDIVEKFGNSSGVSIPTAICQSLGERLEKESFLICLAGFGVGLTWGSLLMRIGNLNFNKIIYGEF